MTANETDGAPGTQGVDDLGSPGQRVAAWLLDAMLSAVVLAPFFIVMAALGYLGPDGKIDPPVFSGLLLVAWLSVMGLAVYFDGSPGGATPGKMVIGIRVADQEARGQIGYRRATVRRIVYLLGGWCFYLGWLWGLWDRRSQTWHDKAAHSLVVLSDRRWSVLSAVLLWVAVVSGTSAAIDLIQGETRGVPIWVAISVIALVALAWRELTAKP